MKRIGLVSVAALVALAVLIVIAPILLIGAIVAWLIAWRRPAVVERVSASRRLARVPAPVRATPLRFATSLVVGSLVLVGASAAVVGPQQDPGSGHASAASGIAGAPPGQATPSGTATARPSATRMPSATPSPTRTPTPTPAATPVFGREPTGPTELGTVVNIVDGDTIDVIVDGVEVRVRYIGMDTPEVHSGFEWLGAEAQAANAELVDGKEVVLERDVSETDQYGRALRYVWLPQGDGWLLVNLELIRLGFASVTTFPPDVKYVDALYLAAQDEAQAAGLGLWGEPPTSTATPVPFAPPTNCEPSYPDICIPIGVADLDCGDMYAQGISMIRVRYDVPNPDPHRFDGSDNDGWGCEGG